jgi:hypothetical protein
MIGKILCKFLLHGGSTEFDVIRIHHLIDGSTSYQYTIHAGRAIPDGREPRRVWAQFSALS